VSQAQRPPRRTDQKVNVPEHRGEGLRNKIRLAKELGRGDTRVTKELALVHDDRRVTWITAAANPGS
jgi:hypothetical protein